MEGFDSLSPKQEEAFDKFIQYARNQDTTANSAPSPPAHPYLYDFLLTETDQHQGFFEKTEKPGSASMPTTTIFRCTAVMTPPALRGWMRPTFSMASLQGLWHRQFFPGVPQVLQDVENNTLPDPQRDPAHHPAGGW